MTVKLDGYASHLPVISALRNHKDPWVEIGSGFYSTPMFRYPTGYSIEPDDPWREYIQQFYPWVRGPEHFETMKSWRCGWLIDAGDDLQRLRYAEAVLDNCVHVVIHDATESAMQHWGQLTSRVPHWCIWRGMDPPTLVLSKKPLPPFFSLPQPEQPELW